MQKHFDEMSAQVLGKMDEMGGRIDQLERSINDLMALAEQQPDNQQLQSSERKQ